MRLPGGEVGPIDVQISPPFQGGELSVEAL
jgi:hypothetical protein